MTCCSSTPRWRGRQAISLTNGVVSATLLPKGGHLAAWRFTSGHGTTQQNALWEAPWTTHDAGTAEGAQFAGELGDLGVGRFLASATGHALCLDGFGPASAAEVAQGAGLHGEASIVEWVFSQASEVTAEGTAHLPLAQLRVTREFSLRPGESVLRVAERVTNLAETGSNLHWVQHATIGQPMFSEGAAKVAASVEKGLTWPLAYEGEDFLARNSRFVWPEAPRADGGMADLRELFAKRGTGFVAAGLQIPGREHGFVAAWDAEQRVAMGYVFSAAVFPWVTFWEENRARSEAPWHNAVMARGLEFGTTPLPLGNAAVDGKGPVFGTPTSLWLEAKATQHAPWILFLAEIPSDCEDLQDITVGEDEIVLHFRNGKTSLAALNVADFLHGDRSRQKVTTS